MIKLESKDFVDIIKDKKKLLFIFDYDGTLTPLVEHHGDAIFTKEKKEILNKLYELNSSNLDIKMAIVTGRTLKSLKKMLREGLEQNILLIGTHGAEIGEEIQHSKHTAQLKEIKANFANEEHIAFEEKILALTIHYKKHPDKIKLRERLIAAWEKHQDIFRIQEGHDVFEYLPKDINKGIAIDHLHKQYPDHFLMYFGDDLTDNFAFSKVNEHKGLSIQVQDKLKEQEANYQIHDVEETYKLINEFLATKLIYD